MITRGKDKGETGVIKRVIRSQNRVIVEGKNLVRPHSFSMLLSFSLWIFLMLVPLKHFVGHFSYIMVIIVFEGKSLRCWVLHSD